MNADVYLQQLERKRRGETWEAFRVELSRVTDVFGMGIDPGILEPVIGLNLFGITTVQSCEGHTERGTGAPWIMVGVRESEEIARLQKDLDEAMKRLEAMEKSKADKDELIELYAEVHRRKRDVKKPKLHILAKGMTLLDEFYGIARQVPHDVRLMLDASGKLTNHGAHVQEIREIPHRHNKLKEYQDEMKAFGFYLKHKFILGV
jgi:hypothetical protein